MATRAVTLGQTEWDETATGSGEESRARGALEGGLRSRQRGMTRYRLLNADAESRRHGEREWER